MPQPSSSKLAILIGIGRYQYLNELTTPERDIAALADLLEKDHQYTTVQCLNPDAQSLRQFLKSEHLQALLREHTDTASDHTSVLIYFAGHGYAEESEQGIKGYLIPADGQRGDRHTWVDMAELIRSLEQLPCQHQLLVLDCCFGGSIRWASKYRKVMFAPERLFKSHYHYYTSRRSSQVLTSTAPDQSALDLLGHGEKEGYSPFAYCLLQALAGQADSNGDQVITLAELYAWLQPRVLTITKELNNVQNIGLFPLDSHDQGEYLFPLAGFDPEKLRKEDLENPYRGLESYEPENSQLFFGRAAAIAALKSHALQYELTVVVGASGTGKSSLVKAGLVPRLSGVVKMMTPGRKPLDALRQAGDFDTLVIDQFEHLVTQATPADAEVFFQKLSALLATEKRIIITVRIDYENQLHIPENLKKRWEAGRFLAPPFSAEELREVIITPALRVGRFIEPPALVDKIISEVIHFPGSLPLLSFTMRELFERSKKQKNSWYSIEEAEYVRLGGVIGSLQKRADYVYENPVAHGDKSGSEVAGLQHCMRNLLLRMVSLTGGEVSGRRVIREELRFNDPAETRRMNLIIERLLEERLIRSDKDAEGKDFIEPAHDALVRSWKKMQEWIAGFTEGNVLLLDNLGAAARDHQQRNGDKEYLWHENPRLEQAAGLIKLDNVLLTDVEYRFTLASLAEKKRLRNRFIGVAIVVAVMIIGAAIVAFLQRETALENEKEAKKNLRNYEIADSNRLVEERKKERGYLDKYLIDGDQLMKSRDYHIARRKYYNADSIYRNFLEKDQANKALGDSIKRKLWVSDSLWQGKLNR